MIFHLCLLHLPAFGEPLIPGYYGDPVKFTPRPPDPVCVPRGIIQTEGVSGVEYPADNQAIIHQNDKKAIIDWETFNIGRESYTHFDQQGQTGWAILNRIHDNKPSQIFGQLTADGKVYLINQNGILFGPGSRVNVHSLIASSLNINDEDFRQGILKFNADPSSKAVVSNHGNIETPDGGSVFLFGTSVENSGTIDCPMGQVGLAAGTAIELVTPSGLDTSRPGKIVKNSGVNPGTAVNFENGRISADLGLAGMYGKTINQQGLIRSVTAVKRNGNIELLATDKVATGAKSITACPVSDSSEKVHQSFPFMKSSITIGGWDPSIDSASGSGMARVNTVEHLGSIEAPAGQVNITADTRVYLGEESMIDVSGQWVGRPGETNLIETKLNSVELRDDFGQKTGPLKGETITFNANSGSSIGNVSGSLSSEEQTALERCSMGGDISIESFSGDIILRKGSLVDFSGGGTLYSRSFGETTKLLAGHTVYDISTAPQWIQYDKVLGFFRKEYPRFGVWKDYQGLYYGGIAPVMEYQPSYIEGGNAGSLILKARRLVLDGQLHGSAFRGIFQTEFSQPLDEFGFTTTRGVVQPKGGTLEIGYYDFKTGIDNRDLYTDEIVVQSQVQPLAEDFAPGDSLSGTFSTTYIPEYLLNTAGLADIKLYSNTGITTGKDTRITLPPGGSFQAAARSIVHQGEITAPGGFIRFDNDDNITSFETTALGQPNNHYIPLPGHLPEGIHLKEGSIVTAAGEKIDYLLPPALSGLPEGGDIRIFDKTSSQGGIHIDRGALLDVSGGYVTSPKGEISGGGAGLLDLRSLHLSLAGDLRGHALYGQTGGTLSLHTGDIRVVPNTSSQQESTDHQENTGEECILPDNFWASTGFTHIGLISENDIHIQEGSILAPSQVKLAQPLPRITPFSPEASIIGTVNKPDLTPLSFITVPFDELGSSSVTCKAGVPVDRTGITGDINLEAAVSVDSGAKIQTSIGGKVEVKAPSITIAGSLEAPAGTISASANDLVIGETGRITAAGFNKPDKKPRAQGLPTGFTSLSGGSVKLEATGNLILEDGCLIDVSGPSPAFTLIQNADGSFTTVPTAGDAGSLTLSFGGYLNPRIDSEEKTVQGRLDGVTLLGHGKMDGAAGGKFIIERKDVTGGLNIYADDMKRIVQKSSPDQSGGFDALELRSWSGIEFAESLNLTPERSLTLDAPLIKAAGAEQVYLRAPWLRLVNSAQYNFQPSQTGEAMIQCSANWIDTEGDIQFSGFQDVQLNAEHDLTLSDRHTVFLGFDLGWKGELNTAGNLTLRAERIYPTTLSQVTIHSDRKVTILPGENTPSSTIYSAGGKLTIEADSIEHRGTLAAPMGEIALCQNGETGEISQSRIYLAAGSKITTTGEASVNYGDLSNTSWTIPDKSDKNEPSKKQAATLPHNSVSLNSSEIIFDKDALISADGGGEIFAYQFLPGIEGSRNPLSASGRSVILPDNSIVLPGKAVYLEGVEGVPQGIYSLLPEQFAFMPGALVITDLGPHYTIDTLMLSKEGSPVTRGFTTIRDTGFTATVPHIYSIRPAEKVVQEGNFTLAHLTAGNAGEVTIRGNTSVLEGTVSGKPLPGFEGNRIELGGKTVFVGQFSEALLPGFSFDEDMPAFLKDKLYIDAGGLSGKGFKEIVLGGVELNGKEYQGTANITIQDGAHLAGTNLTLAATQDITVQSGALLQAEGEISKGEGSISLISPKGRVTIEENASVHASNVLNLECKNIASSGDIQVDNSTLNLMGERIEVTADPLNPQNESSLVFTPQELADITRGFTHLSLTGRREVVFHTALDLDFGDAFLILNTPRMSGRGLSEGDAVSLTSSKRISLLNTGLPGEESELPDTATLSLTADELVIGQGDISFDGFRKINLTSGTDLVFSGKGSLAASGDELNIKAARVTASSSQAGEPDSPNNTGVPYEVARFTVNAPDSRVAITRNGQGTAGENTTPGGSLSVAAQNIILDGLIEVQSGQIALDSRGEAGGIFLNQGSQILAQGSDYAPGGKVSLSTEAGQIDIADGALVDVSAGDQGDAGTISLYAPQGKVVLDGEIKGNARDSEARRGRGGRFTLDTTRYGQEDGPVNLAQLNGKLKRGGFDRAIDLRFRAGDIALPENEQLSAHSVKLVADGGNLDIFGIIEAPAGNTETGRVELYSRDNLTLHASNQVGDEVTGIYAPAGEVILGTARGTVILGGVEPGEKALIDVGGEDDGEKSGGTVTIRVPRENLDNLLNSQATVQGASEVIVEAVKAYDFASGVIGAGDIDKMREDTATFMSGLSLEDGGTLHIRPGIEISHQGSLSLSSDWDFTAWRYNGEPGSLSLRAGNDLNIAGHLLDKGNDSTWRFDLAAGSDRDSADPLAVIKGTGNLNVTDNTAVYTENAPISFASGNNTTIGHLSSSYAVFKDIEVEKIPFNRIPFNMASESGRIQGTVEGSLILKGGAIQTGTGDIQVEIGNDLDLDSYFDTKGKTVLGSIRTLGEHPSPAPSQAYWEYTNGGGISIEAGGTVGALQLINKDAWDWANNYIVIDDNGDKVTRTAWSASYERDLPTQGLAAMAGGDVKVFAGSDLYCQIGTFGSGDCEVFSGGDIDGKFLVKEGRGYFSAMGNVGGNIQDLTFEVFDSQISVTSQGNIHLGTIVNPTTVRDGFNVDSLWNLTYSPDARVTLRAESGDVSISGKTGNLSITYPTDKSKKPLLPPTLKVYAGRDIHLSGNVTLTPSETGNLEMIAGRDIDGLYSTGDTFTRSSILLSDLEPSTVYGEQSGEEGINIGSVILNNLVNSHLHAANPVHRNDTAAVTIHAGRDLKDMSLYLPKKADIFASGDIRDIEYIGQSILPTDATRIRAGEDILFSTSSLVTGSTGIEHGGPGFLLVQAGNSIDLGASKGIQSVGHYYNPALGLGKSSLAVVSGYSLDLDNDKISTFFQDLKTKATEYCRLLNEEGSNRAALKLEEIRQGLIDPFLQSAKPGDGHINMFDSQINASGEMGDLAIIARGDINIGRTTFPTDNQSTKNSGIYTAAGGMINIFAGGDVNVNESRLMTFRGGDILAWSDLGNINAGRGSKTAINTEPPKLDIDENGEIIGVKFEPPAVGSGIRTLTYDPDGFEGPLEAPLAGDVFLFAPTGEIDAGEAEIVGRNISMAARSYKNVQNISFSEGSIGVPSTGESSANIGALTGAGNLAPQTKLSEESSVTDSPAQRLASSIKQAEEAFSFNKDIDVEVIGFEEGSEGKKEKKDKEEDKDDRKEQKGGK
ncbi:MAG: filamentous hemagglutinin family protein [bacterium]